MEFGLNPLQGFTGSPSLNLEQPQGGLSISAGAEGGTVAPFSMSTGLRVQGVNWEKPPEKLTDLHRTAR